MRYILLVLACLLCISLPGSAAGEEIPARLARTLHPSDGLLVTEETGRVVFSQNAETAYAPASILKIATALFALDTLGETYRFPTAVALSTNKVLHLKGYGDPLLTSEVIDAYAAEVANDLKAAGIRSIRGIGVDDRYFQHVTIPGVIANSHQPYDAPNGALCANFNTVFYTRNREGKPVSAEPQTPMLPFMARRIPKEAPKGRIRLAPDESRLYAGHLFRWFLQKHGITVEAAIAPLPFPTQSRLYKKQLFSPFALPQVIEKLMTFSNNFMANQLFLAAAAHCEAPPATLEKGRKAFCDIMTKRLAFCPDVVEGSGISRQNRVSAQTMDALLLHFSPYRHLLQANGNARFKTGTLTGVSSRAGYLTTQKGTTVRFVIITNRKHGDAGVVLRALKKIL